jgi:2-dehydro-3-deoxyphosphogluconate aldolase / (4S)-4-hydroxy-2-oxoglutarate aldolase
MLGEAADFFSERLAVAPVLAVLRGHDPHSSVQVAEVCWNAGVELVEVSLSHDRALEAVTAVCRRGAELGRVAGAGTVCTAGEVRAAAEAGASFVVAPGLARDAVEAARHVSLPYLPGVATPSEVQAALALGCRTLKLFPARELGPGWIRAARGAVSRRPLRRGGRSLRRGRDGFRGRRRDRRRGRRRPRSGHPPSSSPRTAACQRRVISPVDLRYGAAPHQRDPRGTLCRSDPAFSSR